MERWMSFLPRNLKISDLRLPGTHNSGCYELKNNGITSSFIKGLTLCQNRNIYQQLNAGVRCFDIRFEDGYIKHTYDCTKLANTAYHIRKFIREQPTEIIILFIKCKYGYSNFLSSLGNYRFYNPDDLIGELIDSNQRVIIVGSASYDNHYFNVNNKNKFIENLKESVAKAIYLSSVKRLQKIDFVLTPRISNIFNSVENLSKELSDIEIPDIYNFYMFDYITDNDIMKVIDFNVV